MENRLTPLEMKKKKIKIDEQNEQDIKKLIEEEKKLIKIEAYSAFCGDCSNEVYGLTQSCQEFEEVSNCEFDFTAKMDQFFDDDLPPNLNPTFFFEELPFL